MKFFVDTADVKEIAELAQTGLLDGVTTNPSLIHKSGRNFLEVVKEIAGIVDGPVSAEVVATEFDEMMREADVVRAVAPTIAVKLPLTLDGLKACKRLPAAGPLSNVPICFRATPALPAARRGASL